MGNPKMAIITRGSSGIGLAISGRLASENYNVINADIQPPMANLGNNIRHLACDIPKAGDVAGLSRMVQHEGKPDVLILNTGRGIHEKIRGKS
jgi:NAD(P)-dependent dehydrogenase (short-subunit alcohol dehydrogenase family)